MDGRTANRTTRSILEHFIALSKAVAAKSESYLETLSAYEKAEKRYIPPIKDYVKYTMKTDSTGVAPFIDLILEMSEAVKEYENRIPELRGEVKNAAPAYNLYHIKTIARWDQNTLFFIESNTHVESLLVDFRNLATKEEKNLSIEFWKSIVESLEMRMSSEVPANPYTQILRCDVLDFIEAC